MSVATQKIFRVRRDYNTWVANETLEDYALRYTPRSFRRWSEFRVANTAFGAVSFLALEAIGGAMALNYGFSNALWAILVVGLITFMTGLPISYYAARYGVDMDLLTRGAGFGYLGSTITSLIYASFTFIFFALEAAIMALALEMYFDLPLSLCYVLSSLLIIPLVTHGITLINRLQWWTQPVWLALLLLPFLAILFKHPEAYREFTDLSGHTSGSNEFSWLMFGAAATVAFALVVQIGEQVDYLRFLPEKTKRNRVRWWAAVLVAGPGWIVPGMLKMLGGAFLAHLVLQMQIPPERAVEPTQMYLAGFQYVFGDARWALLATVVFVVVSQVKINVTNAYAGSLAWSNFFARLTHSHPGRVVWLVFNVLIAILLMSLGVFQALEHVLGLYGNVAIAWVGALVADLVINKPLGLSPRHIEFKRAHLYDLNPVGLGATLIAALLAIVAYTGNFGPGAQAFAPFIALGVAMVAAPILAVATRGRYNLARSSHTEWQPGELVRCTVCENRFEAEDMARCPAYGGAICSLCCTLESRCHDRCKTNSRAADQMLGALARLLPDGMSRRVNFRVGHYVFVTASLGLLLATIMGVVYYQESVSAQLDETARAHLRIGFEKAFAMLMLVVAVCGWWVVLGSESRRMAQDESNRQNQLLTREIDAHRRTDAALQHAKEVADAANLAKTRYVTGMSHELRTPLNSIFGYAQILLRDRFVHGKRREAVASIHRSGEHLLSLIDGLLDLARIEAGRLRLDPAPLPLREFIDDLVRMVQPQAHAKGLGFQLECHGRMPAQVMADAKRLRQILINLLANAVKFTEQGVVRLRVEYRMEVARFEIIDTGIGIAPEDLQRIFLPFERSSAGRRVSEPGTGLGLTITKLLTELMGGDIAVESEPGMGSRFTLRLYLRELSTPAGAREHRPIVGYDGARRSLLIVDDQPDQRHMLAGLLVPLGFTVHEAASGRECMESIAESVPDAILMDVSMDDMDGWETCRRLRARGLVDTPVIMVSANVFENRIERLAGAGAQAFVGKPVVESELLATLATHLRLSWQTALPQPAPASALTPTQLSGRLPEDDVGELLTLVQFGKLPQLRQRLTELAHEHPHAAEDCALLARLAERFDLEGLKRILKESIRVTEH
ncbi:hybrid sensor histidine kinase/response regulator [Uliginosibacterium sp. H1]|uniref:hybrid sensor histidine kinase/response regulator n=1 Tax=Uliginosibacterium sp. H1 TaxID=3114757 RepID=UPI002E198240|nr:ATP-binding protein [Uliginosibacterium sp. H1]